MALIRSTRQHLRRWRFAGADRRIARTIDTLRRDASFGVNLGCGSFRVDGLINCDRYEETADRRVDLLDVVQEFGESSVDHLESHHALEHLSIEESHLALREWVRVLKPGGSLVITCPDLDALARDWVRSDEDRRWSRLLPMIYGSQEHVGMFHRSGFNRHRLSHLVAALGCELLVVHSPFPLARSTPSIVVVARKRLSSSPD